MAKPPKDPTKPPSTPVAKPAARRAPRNAAAKPAARRTTAAPKPAATPPVEATKAATPPKPARSAKPRAPAAPRTAATRAKAATTKATAAIKKAPASAKAALDAVPGSARAWTIGAVVAAAGAGLAAFLTRGRIAKLLSREGHVPVDLLYPDRDGPVKHGDERAPEAFRPDMDAPMTAAEREALRPATGSAPSLTADRGSTNA